MEIDIIDLSLKQINRELLTGWTVFYYIDNQLVRYDSTTHNWADLPKIGVMVLFRHYSAGYSETIMGTDFYCPYQLMNVEDVRPYLKYGKFLDDTVYNNEVLPQIINYQMTL